MEEMIVNKAKEAMQLLYELSDRRKEDASGEMIQAFVRHDSYILAKNLVKLGKWIENYLQP